jgi:hypothetical protein
MKAFFPAAAIAVYLSIAGFGQMVSMNPFDISPPTIFDQVKAVRSANQKMTPAELVDAANKLLEKQGIAFTFSFDEATCQAVDKSIKSLKNPPPRVNLRTKLRSVGAEAATLTLPPADFSNSQCSKCSVTLPVFEVTDQDFIALMLGTNIKFHRPTNFLTSEAYLVDDKDLTTIKKKWRIPFRSVPLGVSYDENVLYIALHDTELKDLSLAVFSEGVFQFATREEAESNGKPTPLQGVSEVSLMRFENRELKHVVKFSKSCGN